MTRAILLAALMAPALTVPASALDRGPPAQTFGPVKAPRIDLKDLVITGTSPAASCLSTDGAYATDGTSSWEPTCFGVFTSAGQDIRVFGTRGTPKDNAGNPSGKVYASSVIQAQANGGVEKESNGQYINVDVVGGPVSAAALDTTNATGQLISLRQRPGPNGEKPPSAWGQNIDFHIAPGSGNVLSWGSEIDLDNFNKDCRAGNGCISAGIFLNGVNRYPNTAWIFSGTGNTHPYSGTATVAGNVVTRVSGDQFDAALTLLTINGTEYRVVYQTPNQMVGEVVIPAFPSPTAWSSKNAAVHDGILFNGTSNVSDNDFHAATSARTAFRAAGRHHIGLDTSSDTLTYASVAAANQLHCYNGYDACWSFAGGLMRYTNGGATPLQIVSTVAGGNGFKLTAGAPGAGPILEPQGTDANVPLIMRGAGTSPVQIAGDAQVSGGLLVSGLTANAMRQPVAFTPPSASAPCNTGDHAWDAAYEYRCVATNTWKRSALSSW